MQAWPPTASPALQGESLVIVANMSLNPRAISTFPFFVLGAFASDSGNAVVIENIAELDELEAPDGD